MVLNILLVYSLLSTFDAYTIHTIKCDTMSLNSNDHTVNGMDWIFLIQIQIQIQIQIGKKKKKKHSQNRE